MQCSYCQYKYTNLIVTFFYNRFYPKVMNRIKELLGRRIKELREKRGYTQQQLAEKIGIDQRNLSKIECGITFPSKSLPELSRCLQISLPQLFDFEHLKVDDAEKKVIMKGIIDELSPYELDLAYKILTAIFN